MCTYNVTCIIPFHNSIQSTRIFNLLVDLHNIIVLQILQCGYGFIHEPPANRRIRCPHCGKDMCFHCKKPVCCCVLVVYSTHIQCVMCLCLFVYICFVSVCMNIPTHACVSPLPLCLLLIHLYLVGGPAQRLTL